MVAARELHTEHDVTVFEAQDYIGGHTNTVDVFEADRMIAVDTGFIVFNEKTYPGFCSLLKELDVPWKESDMSFSVRCERSGLEYNGTSLNGLFAQRRNLVSPAFWSMVRDIMRFYREAPAVLEGENHELTLGNYLREGGYSRLFIEKHLMPMGAAVWSSSPAQMERFPLRFLVQFFHNHGFLQVDDRPQWLVVRGGSREYVRKLVAPFRERVHLSTPVLGVRRGLDGVLVRTEEGVEGFDRVILAVHAPLARRILEDATADEDEILGAIEYQPNEAVLHTDSSLMPKRRRAWASWNYHLTDPASDLPTVTYWMNALQGFEANNEYFVTLNRTADIDPSKVLRTIAYQHPIYSVAAVQAQKRHHEIDGVHGVHFCGAYWSYGFHEDGVQSALRVTRRIQEEVAV